MTLRFTMRGGHDGGRPIRPSVLYGAVAMRVIFLAIFYVETPVQILQQALVLIF